MKLTDIFATFHKINSHCYFELYKGTEHRDLYEILSDYHFRQNHFAATLPRQSLRDRSNADLKVDAPRARSAQFWEAAMRKQATLHSVKLAPFSFELLKTEGGEVRA